VFNTFVLGSGVLLDPSPSGEVSRGDWLLITTGEWLENGEKNTFKTY
jgi:hypothetical protein